MRSQLTDLEALLAADLIASLETKVHTLCSGKPPKSRLTPYKILFAIMSIIPTSELDLQPASLSGGPDCCGSVPPLTLLSSSSESSTQRDRSVCVVVCFWLLDWFIFLSCEAGSSFLLFYNIIDFLAKPGSKLL